MSTIVNPGAPMEHYFEISTAESRPFSAYQVQAGVSSGPSESFESRWEEMQCALESGLDDAMKRDRRLNQEWRSWSLGRGLSVLAALPTSAPLPDIDVDYDGDVRLEWVGEMKNRAVLSIDANNVLSYAAVWPGGGVHGDELFMGGLPEVVWTALGKVSRVHGSWRLST